MAEPARRLYPRRVPGVRRRHGHPLRAVRRPDLRDGAGHGRPRRAGHASRPPDRQRPSTGMRGHSRGWHCPAGARRQLLRGRPRRHLAGHGQPFVSEPHLIVELLSPLTATTNRSTRSPTIARSPRSRTPCVSSTEPHRARPGRGRPLEDQTSRRRRSASGARRHPRPRRALRGASEALIGRAFGPAVRRPRHGP